MIFQLFNWFQLFFCENKFWKMEDTVRTGQNYFSLIFHYFNFYGESSLINSNRKKHNVCLPSKYLMEFLDLFLAHLAIGHVSFCHGKRPSVSFSHLNLLLWNCWTEISQTCQKCSLDGPLPDLCFWCWFEIQHGCQGP